MFTNFVKVNNYYGLLQFLWFMVRVEKSISALCEIILYRETQKSCIYILVGLRYMLSQQTTSFKGSLEWIGYGVYIILCYRST